MNKLIIKTMLTLILSVSLGIHMTFPKDTRITTQTLSALQDYIQKTQEKASQTANNPTQENIDETKKRN